MGDRVTTSIRIGGKLKSEDVETLIDLLVDEGATAVDPLFDEMNLNYDLDLTEVYNFVIDQCNYANIDDLKTLFTTLGLAYHQTWEAGGGFGAGQTRCLHDSFGELDCAGEEHAMFPATRILEASLDPGQLIKLFEEAEWWEKKLPPLEIID